MSTIDLKKQEVWFLTGSQHLYGNEALAKVAANSRRIAEHLDACGKLPVRVVCKPTLTDAEAIQNVCLEANNTPHCVGVITWMHTFSPSKMWIAGLSRLQKPLAHLHTQTERELPWDKIDMDFMNLNQSAHGDREFGFIGARLRLERKIIVGYWKDEDVLAKLDGWARSACGLAESRRMKIVRFGGMNMREVAVTGGDRLEAQLQLGWSVNGHAVGDLVGRIADVSDSEVDTLVSVYEDSYSLVPALRKSGERRAILRDAARQEIGMRSFLREGGFSAFTTTFEDLHGLKQLPGLACQRLMAEGYGFGAEGDWKTAALLRVMKVMSVGRPGGTSFMEDYTYHLAKGRELVLGAHMLEVCPTISDTRPSLEVHALDIGGKSPPCRLVFTAGTGPALNATLVDMGGRMRMIVNELEVVKPEQEMPHLPVAHAVWKPLPDFKSSCEAWILAGGAHHSGFSRAVTVSQLRDFAAMTNLEFIHIGPGTNLDTLKNELRWNDLAYRLAR